MTDPVLYVTISVVGLAGLAMLIAAGLAGWREWLRLKNRELDQHGATVAPPAGATAGTRIEMADLRERIRKLEAIAAGVDL